MICRLARGWRIIVAMATLELFVSRWDSGTELYDAELAFDVSILAVAIEPDR